MCPVVLNFVNVFSLFRDDFPLKKDGTLHLKTLDITKGCFVPSLVEINPVVPEKKRCKNKNYDNDDFDDKNDDDGQFTTCDQKNPLEPLSAFIYIIAYV